MAKFVVTGSAGFIGSTLSEALLEAGHSVVGIDSFTDYYAREQKQRALSRSLEAERFEFLEQDLLDLPLNEVAGDADGIFHLAAQPGVRGSWGEDFEVYLRNNILATQRVLEAAQELELRVVFASSSSIYGEVEEFPIQEGTIPRPISPYGVTKLAGETLAAAYIRSSDLDVVSLRYFTVFGPRQRPDMAFSRIVSALLEGRPFTVFGDGHQSRDFTFVSDAVAATIAAMNEGPGRRAYNVGGGTEATLREIIATFEELSGRSLDARFEGAAKGDPRRTFADTEAIRRDLGWSPEVNLRTGLQLQLDDVLASAGPGS
jgi:UDP-glucuronate 4-epimerase